MKRGLVDAWRHPYLHRATSIPSMPYPTKCAAHFLPTNCAQFSE